MGADIAMEILASLPRAPYLATYRDLCADFGFGLDKDVRAVIARIRGIRFIHGRVAGERGGPGCNGIGIDQGSWAAARAAAIAYWDREYGT